MNQRISRPIRNASYLAGLLAAVCAWAILTAPIAAAHHVDAPAATIVPHAAKTLCKSVGANPEFTAYDPITKWYYTSVVNSGLVAVYKGACTFLGNLTLPSGANPRGIAYSPATHKIYVADYSLDQVYVISKLHLVQTVTSPTFDGPWAIAYDPAAGFIGGGGVMAVTDYLAGNLTFIGQTSPTGSALAYYALNLGNSIEAVCYSPLYNALMTTNPLNDTVTAIDATTGSVLATFAVGIGPVACAYSPSTSETLVVNLYSNNVSIVYPYGVSSTVAVGTTPEFAAYDPNNSQMYVSNAGSSNVSKINAAGHVAGTISLASGSGPIGLAFDESTNQMVIDEWSLGDLKLVK